MRINEVTYEKLKTPLKVNGNLKDSVHTQSFYQVSVLQSLTQSAEHQDICIVVNLLRQFRLNILYGSHSIVEACQLYDYMQTQSLFQVKLA